MQIISVPLLKIWLFFIFNIIFHVFVIGFGTSMNSMTWNSSVRLFQSSYIKPLYERDNDRLLSITLQSTKGEQK